jgi:hypothetical protein
LKYLWKNLDTDEVVEVERPASQYDVPPDDSGKWEKVYEGFAFTGPKGKGNW